MLVYSTSLMLSLFDMSENRSDCSLCGLPVEIVGFTLTTPQGEKVFCCEGCKSIFKLLNKNELLADSDQD